MMTTATAVPISPSTKCQVPPGEPHLPHLPTALQGLDSHSLQTRKIKLEIQQLAWGHTAKKSKRQGNSAHRVTVPPKHHKTCWDKKRIAEMALSLGCILELPGTCPDP